MLPEQDPCALRRMRSLTLWSTTPLSHRTEKRAQSMLLVVVLLCAVRTWKTGHYFYDDPWLAVGVTIFGHFAAFLQHFSGSSSELSPRVSAQALAHEKLVSVTCIVVVRLWSYTLHLVNACQKQPQQPHTTAGRLGSGGGAQ